MRGHVRLALVFSMACAAIVSACVDLGGLSGPACQGQGCPGDSGDGDASASTDGPLPDVGVDVATDAFVATDGNDCHAGPAPDPGEIYLWLECEEGIVTGDMIVSSNQQYPGSCGAYAQVGQAGATDYIPSPPTPLPTRVDIPVTIPRTGTYVLWVRVSSPGQSGDALYGGFSVNDLRRFYPRSATYPFDNSWTWTNNDDTAVMVFSLIAGNQTLTIGPGEHSVRCDRILLTTDTVYTPPP